MTTHWTAVIAAAGGDSTHASAALEELCRAYWYPLYVYVRRRGHDSEEAKDLTQEFFARLLEKKQLASVERGRAKFRSWLLGVMNHFLDHEWTKGRAQKRGGGKPLISLDDTDAEDRYKLEPADNSTPEKTFDQRWALAVLDNARARLHNEYVAAGKAELYQALKDCVSMVEPEAYGQIAERLGMSTSAIKSAIHRLRQRYQDLVRAEIAQTVASTAEIDEEIRYLLAVLRG